MEGHDLHYDEAEHTEERKLKKKKERKKKHVFVLFCTAEQMKGHSGSSQFLTTAPMMHFCATACAAAGYYDNYKAD